MDGLVFQRVEKKYLMTNAKCEALMKAWEPYLEPDIYGHTMVCNVYYDTPKYDLIRHSIEGPSYKEKLRLRSYGVPSQGDTVFVELKKKYKGIVYKRRATMELTEAENYLNQGIRPALEDQIINEVDFFLDQYKPIPRLYLAYDRDAFVGIRESNVRVTFDRNIRSRRSDLALECGDHGEYLLDDDKVLMEIKVPSACPIWMVHALSELEIYPKSFSKYGNIYKTHLLEKTGGILHV